jgi:general secretion pathway protein G
MHRAFAVLLLFTILCSNVGCVRSQQSRKEAILQGELVVLRREFGQFALDHQQPPTSLSELVSGGYLKQIPTDPFTGTDDTWRIEKSGEHCEVYSGSDVISSKGTPYSSW